MTMLLHIETPLIESAALCRAERAVWLKLDALQPSGSFKIRGVGAACTEYVRRGAKRLISSSGGNAGIAVAYAGRCLSVSVTVVVPETTSERARHLIRRQGAEVVVHGASWQEANDHAQSMLSGSSAFLHPFDDPLLWEGHATLVDEVARSGIKPDAIVLSVGGGGLLCGVIAGLRRNHWDDVPVIAVETEGAASLSLALERRTLASLDRIFSVATSLGAKQVCRQAFIYAQGGGVRSIVTTDKAAVAACLQFLDDHRILVEPACGASLAIAYENRPELLAFKTVMVVVCGGATTTIDQLNAWSKGFT
jgi:L-serine/L-threonine ammonia-lyase